MLRFVVLLACLFALPAFAQEKVRKTETISTTAKLVLAKLNRTEGFSEIRGTAVFTLAAAHQDGTLTGNLVYTLPETERQKLAQALSKPLTEIPASLTANNLSAKFEKNTHCPDIRLALAELELELAGTKLHLNRFVLGLAETPGKLSRALCIWTDRTNKGITNTGIVQYINLLLKGDEDEEQAK